MRRAAEGVKLGLPRFLGQWPLHAHRVVRGLSCQPEDRRQVAAAVSGRWRCEAATQNNSSLDRLVLRKVATIILLA